MLIAFLFAFSGFSQDIITKQVHFDKGTNGTAIEGKISGYETIDYVLNVRKGQVMNVSMGTDNAANYFNVMEPNEDYVAIFNGSLNENMFEGELMKSGNYKIRVYLIRSAARKNEKANYRLEINVSALNKKASNGDALVTGTDYNATGKIPCNMGNGKSTGTCSYGVKREGKGSGMLTITKPDGRTRIIFFENGKATGYDMSQSDRGEFSASKKFDMFIIKIGDEQYEIPDAVIFGG